MHDSKLIDLLKQLSAKQLSRLEDFVQSPFFNKNQEICQLLTYLKKFHPDFLDAGVHRDQVAVYLKIPASQADKKLANLASQLHGMVENFLGLELMEGQPFFYWLQLSDWFYRKQLKRHANNHLQKMAKWKENFPHKNAPFFFYQFQLDDLRYRQSDPNIRKYNPQLQQVSDSLDLFYLAKKLELTCEMLNFEQTLNLHYEVRFTQSLLPAIEANPFYLDQPAIAVYFKFLKILSDPANVGAFFELKKMLVDFEDVFPPLELKKLYDILLNFCTRRVNLFHDKSFEVEFFELNVFLLEKEILMENGYLSPWRYSNLVTVALRIGKLDWTEKFIHQFRSKLPAEHADNLFNYKLGQLYYHTGKLSEALFVLNQVDLKDSFVSLSVRGLLVRIYYELNETELLLSFLEAFRIYLFRDELVKREVKNQFRNFIDTTRKLAKISAFEKEKLLLLQTQLPLENETIHFAWIRSMLGKKLDENKR